jgi:xanthine permease XanP
LAAGPAYDPRGAPAGIGAPGGGKPVSARKPANIVYALEDSPPILVTAMNGLQNVGVIAINLVYPLLVFRSLGLPIDLVANFISVGMLVLGAATFLQALRLGPVGSGFMCPATFSATYFAPSIVAARAGGLALVFGMTMFAGILELVLAPFLNRLRAVFPPEVSGLVIFMIGVSGGIAGLRSLVGPQAAPMLPADWIVGIVTLGTMIALNVWGKGPASMFCALIGLVVGYIAAGLTGLIDSHAVSAVATTPWIGLPVIHFERSFDLALAAPFVIGSIAAAMKAAGTITVCQKMNDADWVRPDMKSIVAGVLADGASTLLAGAVGAFGTNTSTPAVGIAAATGVASRTVAFAAATIFILMGFLPKLPALLGLMPRPVVVAALLFAVSFVMINGLQIMTSRLLDARRTVIIALSVIAGLAVEVFPSISTSAPPALLPLVSSSLVLATTFALALNLVFRIGVKKTATLTIEDTAPDPEAVEAFFQTQGAKWGARADVIKRAAYGTIQLIDAIAAEYRREGAIVIAVTFDEFNLDVRVSYSGGQLCFPDVRPSLEQIRESEDGARLLAGYMLRRNADRVRSESADDRSRVLFHFVH